MNYMTTTTPPSPADRMAEWYAKAWRAGYDFVTGPKNDYTQVTDYERQETLDGRYASTDNY